MADLVQGAECSQTVTRISPDLARSSRHHGVQGHHTASNEPSGRNENPNTGPNGHGWVKGTMGNGGSGSSPDGVRRAGARSSNALAHSKSSAVLMPK